MIALAKSRTEKELKKLPHSTLVRLAKSLETALDNVLIFAVRNVLDDKTSSVQYMSDLVARNMYHVSNKTLSCLHRDISQYLYATANNGDKIYKPYWIRLLRHIADELGDRGFYIDNSGSWVKKEVSE